MDIILTAQPRHDLGKSASRRLRRDNQLPATVYGGKDAAPRSVSLSHNEMWTQLDHAHIYSHVLTLRINKEKETVVLRALQRHPYRPLLLHADFQRVEADQNINMKVPLHFEGADQCIGVRQDGGVISHILVDVEIQCLPKDLPEYIEVDIRELSLGATIHLSELKLPQGVSFAHSIDEEHDHPVVSVHKSTVAAAEDDEVTESGEEAPDAEA